MNTAQVNADREDAGRPLLPVSNAAQAIQTHLGGTQRGVARTLGLSHQQWNRYIKGRACPSADAVQGWCEAAGVSLVCEGAGWRVGER